MMDLAAYIGQLLERVRKARAEGDTSIFPEIARELEWIRAALDKSEGARAALDELESMLEPAAGES